MSSILHLKNTCLSSPTCKWYKHLKLIERKNLETKITEIIIFKKFRNFFLKILSEKIIERIVVFIDLTNK